VIQIHHAKPGFEHPRVMVNEETVDWDHLRERLRDIFAIRVERIAYLEAENAYTRQVLAPLEPLQERLYDEIRARIQETDTSAPNRKGPWWYYSRTVEGQQYPIHCRRADPDRALTAPAVLAAAESGDPGEEILLDENAASGGNDFFALGNFCSILASHLVVALRRTAILAVMLLCKFPCLRPQ